MVLTLSKFGVIKTQKENEMNNIDNEMNEKREERIRNTSIVRVGDQITIPDGMSFDDAIMALDRKRREEDKEIAVEETFDINPLEGALAFNEALIEKFKWITVDTIKSKSFFAPDQPPKYINVPINLNNTVQVPWGRLTIPGVDGHVDTSWQIKRNKPVFCLRGEMKFKSKDIFADICSLTRKFAKEQSIYKGKALKASFPRLEEATSMEDFFPEFLDLSSIDTDSLVFSKELEQIINVTLFTPIEKTNECRKHNIPLKRGILLEGPYGVGKTLTAHVTAKKCIDNDWTFIYIASVDDLANAIEFARQYQPAVVFSEDLDQALQGKNRDDQVNRILNTIDGINAKGTEIIVVLTTNNVENITQAMLRPERLDAVISVMPPDADAVIRLIRQFAKNQISENEDLTEVGKKLAGHIPASIHEVVQRSKLAAISRTGEGAQITAEDLLIVANGMIRHLKLLEPVQEDNREPIVKAAEVLGQHIEKGITKNNLEDTITKAQNLLDTERKNGKTTLTQQT